MEGAEKWGYDMIEMSLVGDRRLMQQVPWPTKTKSGIELPEEVKDCAGVFTDGDGDYYLVMPYAGVKVGKDHVIIRTEDILAKLGQDFDPDDMDSWEGIHPF